MGVTLPFYKGRITPAKMTELYVLIYVLSWEAIPHSFPFLDQIKTTTKNLFFHVLFPSLRTHTTPIQGDKVGEMMLWFSDKCAHTDVERACSWIRHRASSKPVFLGLFSRGNARTSPANFLKQSKTAKNSKWDTQTHQIKKKASIYENISFLSQ